MSAGLWLLEAFLGGGGLSAGLHALDLDRDQLAEVLVLLVIEAKAHLVHLLVVDWSGGAHGDRHREGGSGVGVDGLVARDGEGLKGHLGALGHLLLLLGESDGAAILPDAIGVVFGLDLDLDALARSELEDVLVLADDHSASLLSTNLGCGNVDLESTVALVPLLLDLGTELVHLGCEFLGVEVTGAIVSEEHELLQHCVPSESAVGSGSLRLSTLGGLLLRLVDDVEVVGKVHLIDLLVLLLSDVRNRDTLLLEKTVEGLTTLADESLLSKLLTVLLPLWTTRLLTLSSGTVSCVLTSKLDAEDDLWGLALDESWDDAVGVFTTGDGEVISVFQVLLLLDDDPRGAIVILEVLTLSLL